MSLAADTDSSTPAERQAEAGTSRGDALVDELERRIHELAGHGEDDLGEFTPMDWVILVLGALVVPILLVIRFAP
jgi:hypothetical protein